MSLSRGGRRVLNDVSLAVASGETVALVGRSGAGKTSFLKLINRLLLPDSGRVVVAGRETTAWDPFELRRRVGYVLQEVGLFPHLSVFENVALVPRLLRWSPARIAGRVAELLEMVGLPVAGFGNRRPDELSGGQRQRVGVARALAGDPPVLLMDEPFGALDPVTRSELHAEFRRIQSALRKTVVLVTHDMAEAFALSDRIGVLADGRLVALAPPRAILDARDEAVRAMLAPLVEARAAFGGAAE